MDKADAFQCRLYAKLDASVTSTDAVQRIEVSDRRTKTHGE
jgi:hypothetical protein